MGSEYEAYTPILPPSLGWGDLLRGDAMTWIHAHTAWILAGILLSVAGWMFWSGCRDLDSDEKEVKRITMEVDDGH